MIQNSGTGFTFIRIRVINLIAQKELYMFEKDYMLYGTKVLNLKTQEIGLLICTWNIDKRTFLKNM